MQDGGAGRASEWSVERSICSAREGSFSAVGQLLDFYRGYLLAVANEELSSDVAQKFGPSDLVQETCYQATRDFPKFEGASDPELKAWLRQILINNLRDVQKQYRQTQKRDCAREISLHVVEEGSDLIQQLTSAEPSPSHMILAEEMRRSVARAIETLSLEQRRVVELRSFEGLSFEEVGKAIGKTTEAARKIWTRCIDELAAEVARDESGERRGP